MTVWLVRAGRMGEHEDFVIQHNIAAIGWNVLPDVSSVKTKDELKHVYEKTYPNTKKMAMANETGQIWIFINRIQKGDLVVLPLKTRSAIAIGEVTGDYQYRTDLLQDIHHTRPVKWIRTDIPRTMFAQDLLYSFGAYMTVCQISRNEAEKRIKEVLTGTLKDQGEGEILDIEQAAHDQILDTINKKFRGHELSRMVEAVLRAQGYTTIKSPAGPDGGVDILAGSGVMGFDSPRICVQVKSSESPADVTVLRNLQGIMKSYNADQGLLVSWGGFNNAVIKESRHSFFTVRLWDSGDLLSAILENYEKLPPDIQAELPLKKIWARVYEEELE